MDGRVDFVIQHVDPLLPLRLLEVKTVVDVDYSASAVPAVMDSTANGSNKKSPKKKAACIFTSDKIPYTRTALFPWGKSNQKGPNGEAVVSARAIKHVREFTRIVRQGKQPISSSSKKKDDNDNQLQQRYDATILFVVIRPDAKSFRPNHEACPSFAKYLHEAHDAGVQILAKQVRWGSDDDELGKCYEGDLLPVDLSEIPDK
jgi:hypothetical protein